MVSIFEYKDYRDILNAFIADQPNNGWGIRSKWAEIISVKSSYIGQILNGSKSLLPDQAFLLGKQMNLSSLEMRYFILLVSSEKAANYELRAFYIAQIDELIKEAKKLKNQISENNPIGLNIQSEYYCHWHYSAIRMLTTLPPGRTANEIADRLSLPMDVTNTALEFLCDHNLCAKQNGRYVSGSGRTLIHKGDTNYQKHLSNWRLQALQKSNLNFENDLFITSPMTMSFQDFENVRLEIMELIKCVSKRVEDSNPQDIFCLNIDFFKL